MNYKIANIIGRNTEVCFYDEKVKKSAVEILETYRYRWQVEMYFKRLKSILGFGELPKKQVDSSLAWLNGKLMVALLVELFLSKSVFPRG
jgi:IS4 transposase